MKIFNENQNEMANRSQQKTNRPRPRHERKSTKYSMTMVTCIEQHPSNV